MLDTHKRIRFKLFCNLPINTPNVIVNRFVKTYNEKEDAETEGLPKIKHVPLNFIYICRKLYMTKCLEHNSVTSTTHLRERHNRVIELPRLLEMYQQPKHRSVVRSRINSAIKFISEI